MVPAAATIRYFFIVYACLYVGLSAADATPQSCYMSRLIREEPLDVQAKEEASQKIQATVPFRYTTICRCREEPPAFRLGGFSDAAFLPVEGMPPPAMTVDCASAESLLDLYYDLRNKPSGTCFLAAQRPTEEGAWSDTEIRFIPATVNPADNVYQRPGFIHGGVRYTDVCTNESQP